MMKMAWKSLVVGVSLFTFSSLVSAHEGHSETPGSIRSMHGGIVKPGKQINLELVAEGSKVIVYPLAHPGDTVDLGVLKIEGKAKDPKGKIAAVKLTKNGDGFSGDIDFKKNLRNELEIKTTYKGSVDTFKFQVEKQ